MQHVIEAGQISAQDVSTVIDERLREKEFGLLDRLTHRGIRERFPDLFEQRRHVGKFYFRPPGGESWCDVILRLRSVLDTVTREYRGERVMVVAHQVIVNCMRYLVERLAGRRAQLQRHDWRLASARWAFSRVSCPRKFRL